MGFTSCIRLDCSVVHASGNCLLFCSSVYRVILRFPLPMRSSVTVCLYQSVEGSLQVLKIRRSSLKSRQRRVTRTATAGGPQGRGVLGPRDTRWQAPREGPATGSVASERQTLCGHNFPMQRMITNQEQQNKYPCYRIRDTQSL